MDLPSGRGIGVKRAAGVISTVCPRTCLHAVVNAILKISDRDHIILMTGTVLFLDGSAGMLGC